jgi:hypothetical protein
MAGDIYDPLSDVTRKERRLLLAVSILAIGIVKTGLLPEKVSALGIEFSHADQKSLLGIFTIIIGYFLAAFVVYAAADGVAWTTSHYFPKVEELHKKFKGVVPGVPGSSLSGVALLLIRAAFEFLLPILVGIIAIVYLFTAKIPQSPLNK